jgi:fibronectin-binding autotransporter adhesin
VIAPGGVSPGSVIFNNSTLAYSITGTGGINGPTALLKQGTGTVTLGTSNAYTGVTRIEGGTLSANTLANSGLPSSLGGASSAATNLVLAGGTLDYTGGAVSIDRGLSVAGVNDASVREPMFLQTATVTKR